MIQKLFNKLKEIKTQFVMQEAQRAVYAGKETLSKAKQQGELAKAKEIISNDDTSIIEIERQLGQEQKERFKETINLYSKLVKLKELESRIIDIQKFENNNTNSQNNNTNSQNNKKLSTKILNEYKLFEELLNYLNNSINQNQDYLTFWDNLKNNKYYSKDKIIELTKRCENLNANVESYYLNKQTKF